MILRAIIILEVQWLRRRTFPMYPLDSFYSAFKLFQTLNRKNEHLYIKHHFWKIILNKNLK